MGSGSGSCIDQIQYVVTVSCFHLFDVMVVYGSLIDNKVYIRGVGPDTMCWISLGGYLLSAHGQT